MIDEAAATSAMLLYHFNPIHDGATGGTVVCLKKHG
jgi:hypothetical protein